MTRWHPWRHLRDRHPDITVSYPHTHDAGCLGRLTEDGIEIDGTSTQRERRCTLTHEIVHIERGPVIDYAFFAQREEVIVDDIASRRLIELDQLIDILVWTMHRVDDEAAEELWVDLPTLIARVKNLTDTERRHIDAELRRRNGVD